MFTRTDRTIKQYLQWLFVVAFICWHTVGCWQQTVNELTRCTVMLTDFHGLYTVGAVGNRTVVWRGRWIGWELGERGGILWCR